MTEAIVRDCLACQSNTIEHNKEPLKMSPLPSRPWSEISVDFADLPNGEHLLVVIDDYSRFPDVEIVSSTSAQQVIPKLDRIFSTFGVPSVVRTDNGPPFNSHEFAQFADYLGFKHRKVTPRWPQANGEVERFMQSLKKVYRCAQIESKSWKQELYKLLRNYRATPHVTTGSPPATLLFGRPMRTRLPESECQSLPDDSAVRERDQQKKSQMKQYADNHPSAREKVLKIGDKVLVRRDGIIPKQLSPYLPVPFTVIHIRGSLVTVEHDSHRITRNVSRLKKYVGPAPCAHADDDDIEHTNVPHAGPPPQAGPPQRRYPQRARQRPRHLRDYQT